MKISGFTIIKDALINDFPVVESIRSLLPVVDEMVVLVGDSADKTEELIRSINDPRIRIERSTWDPLLRQGGAVLAQETNKAFALIDPLSDWAFYIQADEVLHEQYAEPIRAACLQFKDDKRVEGLLFSYLHFYGTYEYVGDSRQWYDHEIRIIRNDQHIQSFRDAQGFRKNGKKLNVKRSGAEIYHYGWVKSPKQMKLKMNNQGRFWNEDTEEFKALIKASDIYDFNNYDSLQFFSGSHPAVMKDRINNKNWELSIDVKKKKLPFIKAVLYYFEKWTGIRPFSYKNYHLLK